MSWLNTSSFTNLAISALKEAQKTIDKALDIQNEEAATPTSNENQIETSADEKVEELVSPSTQCVVVSEPSSNSEPKDKSSVSQNHQDESSTVESFDSSVSTSSSVTVISPDQFDIVSMSDVDTDVKLVEASALLSMMTENSASISGDEIETATSSDIEIIASPQAGFLDSTANRKTHCREPSEASSDDSITSALDIDKMARKISELNQLLEARENKVFELSRNCVQLTEESDSLKSQLSKEASERVTSLETTRRQSEEFSQRLCSVEKRYQQAVAEKEALSKQVEKLKLKQNIADQVAENEETIKELRQEGEKLSKQYLQQSNIIKKLRAKEKDDEQLIKQYRDKSEEFSRELERLKKSLFAKEELERNQIEAVRQLTASNSMIEKELIATKVLLRDCQQHNESLKSELAASKQELSETKASADTRNSEESQRNLSHEVALRHKMQLQFEEDNRKAEEERLALTLRCEDLVRTLQSADADRCRGKEQSKAEISSLMQRLQAAEAQCVELSQAMTSATRPLLRQIENLHNSLSSQRLTEEKSERILQDRLNEMQHKLTHSNEKEAEMREMYLSQQSRLTELIEQLNTVTKEKKQLLSDLCNEKSLRTNMEDTQAKESACVEAARKELKQEMDQLRERHTNLERQYDIQSASLREEKKTTALLRDRLQEREAHSALHADDSTASRGSSPTPSLGKISLSGSITESHSSNPWISLDDVFESGLATPVPKSSLYDTLRAGSNAAVFESLQSQLKTRDGEVFQLQQELHQQEKNRDSLTKELTKMIRSNEELNRRLSALEQLQLQFNELETNYNAILQMYGEKIEENDELRLDLIDVKEMYKAQIDQLLKT